MDRALMLCARDIEQMYFAGIPLQKAIRYMTYLINYQEINAAKRELRNLARNKQYEYNHYKGESINKYLHNKKISKGA